MIAARAVQRLPRSDGHHLVLTEGPGHARALAAEAAAGGVDRVLVCGGDGTVREVAQGLAHTGSTLGLLPAGRGNDLAGALGIPSDPRLALDAFLRGRNARIDLGLVNGEPFCTVTGVGFDAVVAASAGRGYVTRVAGRFGYPLAVLRELLRWNSPMVEVQLDGTALVTGRYLLAAVSNTGRYGGGVRIAPGSRADDGLLDLCLARDMSRGRLLRLFPTAYRGGHVGFDEISLHRGRTVRIEATPPVPVVADGEPAGVTPVDLAVDPLALAVVLPPAGS